MLGWPAHQIRVGPVALQGCGDFANNEVVHLLSGFRIVSGEAGKGALLLTNAAREEPREKGSLSRATSPPQGKATHRPPPAPKPCCVRKRPGHSTFPGRRHWLRAEEHQHTGVCSPAHSPGC